MRNAIIYIFLTSSIIFGSTDVLGFRAEYSGGAVKLQWQSGVELNVREFRIEKSSDNISFHSFTTQTAQGSSYLYTIIDLNPHSKGTKLFYRVVVADYDGNEKVSESVSVNIETSAIGFTWGSIKALFR
ncbi:MAG TPA: hypothetical protein PKW56_00845 [Clostridiales bacterium]|nr:hypothetical protein [Clostridiales bacterium]